SGSRVPVALMVATSSPRVTGSVRNDAAGRLAARSDQAPSAPPARTRMTIGMRYLRMAASVECEFGGVRRVGPPVILATGSGSPTGRRGGKSAGGSRPTPKLGTGFGPAFAPAVVQQRVRNV